MKGRRRLRRLIADDVLIRRRAAGEPLRALARDYDVAHTTLRGAARRDRTADARERRGSDRPRHPRLRPRQTTRSSARSPNRSR